MKTERLYTLYFVSKQNCLLNKTTEQQNCIFYLRFLSIITSRKKGQRKLKINLRVFDHLCFTKYFKHKVLCVLAQSA